MTLRLTPEILAAAYDFLRETQPFKAWKLPDSDDIGFRVTRHNDRFGHLVPKQPSRQFHDIAVSEVFVRTTGVLLATLSHEMAHLYQEVRGTASERAQHNAEFKRLAKAICRAHNFDLATFI